MFLGWRVFPENSTFLLAMSCKKFIVVERNFCAWLQNLIWLSNTDDYEKVFHGLESMNFTSSLFLLVSWTASPFVSPASRRYPCFVSSVHELWTSWESDLSPRSRVELASAKWGKGDFWPVMRSAGILICFHNLVYSEMLALKMELIPRCRKALGPRRCCKPKQKAILNLPILPRRLTGTLFINSP